ncbi:MAG: hypothetical protein QOF58_1712 [Pseudonocardiales bacterium]|jgi:hypothetical protein|nr:hypothetical protein [Pseudonocardiales bacterium]
MGADLIATVIPKLTEESYEKVIAAADDRALATAAFRAGYQGDFGVDPSGESVADLISDEDPAAVELILGQPNAVDVIRDAARAGARYVLGGVLPFLRSGVFEAARLGGPDLLVVGGSAHGDDPFSQFRDVAVLAALLTASSVDVTSATEVTSA